MIFIIVFVVILRKVRWCRKALIWWARGMSSLLWSTFFSPFSLFLCYFHSSDNSQAWGRDLSVSALVYFIRIFIWLGSRVIELVSTTHKLPSSLQLLSAWSFACSPVWVSSRFSPTSEKHAHRWIGSDKLPLGVNECLSGLLRRTGVPLRVYSRFATSVPGIDVGSTITVTRVKMNEWTKRYIMVMLLLLLMIMKQGDTVA